MALYDNILDTIGRTPVVKLNRLAPEHVTLYVKVESFNPGGSVKDRLALAIILDAEQRGLLKPGDTIVEATSGNTGVALAMVAAARGYKFVATMVETFSIERRKLMRAYGAKVILTPAAERGSGMVRKARSWPSSMAGSWPASSPTRPIRPTTATPPRPKSCATSPATGWTISSPAGALAARSPAWAKCCAWPARKCASPPPNRPALRYCRDRTGSRTRSRAGPRTSCRKCSTARSPTKC